MTEQEKLSNKDNYKIYIQQKFNRRKRIKTKYLTSDFKFSEDINHAFEFKDFQEAENILSVIIFRDKPIPRPRIIIKYFENL